MAHPAQIKIAATYLRGGTSKGVFFRLQDLPAAAQVPGAARDALLLRVIGSPDPYGKQIDGACYDRDRVGVICHDSNSTINAFR